MKKLKSKELKPLEVKVENDNVERAISTLKRRMATEGVLKTLKQKRYNVKPAIANKIKSLEAERRRRKERKMRSN
ncbi:30S ribosomal protein S21 [bacterium]|nr:30S ribosomal protein S21 [bacterium]